MMKWEANLRKWLMEHMLLLAYAAVVLLGLFLRYSLLPMPSDDLVFMNASWFEAIKAKGMAGISNIEYAFGAYWQVFSENNIPLTRLSQMASATPCKMLGRNAGLIKEGMRADLILVDTEWTGVVCKDEMISRSNNTPFEGYPLRGRIVKTIVEGEVRYELDNGQA